MVSLMFYLCYLRKWRMSNIKLTISQIHKFTELSPPV